MLAAGSEALQRPGSQAHITAPPVSFRTMPNGQSGGLHGPQVMGQQIGGHIQFHLQFRGRHIPQRQKVHDAEPCRISQGRVLGSTLQEA